jgi:hypothetical protein
MRSSRCLVKSDARKLDEAKQILAALGMPKAQQNPNAVYTFLAFAPASGRARRGRALPRRGSHRTISSRSPPRATGRRTPRTRARRSGGRRSISSSRAGGEPRRGDQRARLRRRPSAPVEQRSRGERVRRQRRRPVGDGPAHRSGAAPRAGSAPPFPPRARRQRAPSSQAHRRARPPPALEARRETSLREEAGGLRPTLLSTSAHEARAARLTARAARSCARGTRSRPAERRSAPPRALAAGSRAILSTKNALGVPLTRLRERRMGRPRARTPEGSSGLVRPELSRQDLPPS